ncbi:RNA polymerase sigma factor [Hyphomonas johnsonii]|jgi:RNA polymerase sigma-70 factor (ECF subfamily)|uniref:RNA polymerase sigma factor n=1 Tax=Hyphomonas johnsonii MHS-2 TaxID=1280950 RepID=A0A059FQI2_9PROT|nr:RNA polymerase sigma factor [Hyphomonas johnsonii]KCZ92872.1 RNA polymerase sigma factor [Hyphomonas johnsonii MHS-2]
MHAAKAAYETLPDIALAELAAARDAYAIRTITTRNNQRLFRAAWSVVHSHADAEDIVQNAYLKAFAAIGTFSGQSSLSTWLTRIVLNTAFDHKRSADRRRAALSQENISMIEDHRAASRSAESPERQVARAELSRTLKEAVAGLPDGYRSVFVLRDVEDMSVRETADALNMSEASVKTRLFRARRLLREALEPDLTDLFSDSIAFAGADCDAMTARILDSLGLTLN